MIIQSEYEMTEEVIPGANGCFSVNLECIGDHMGRGNDELEIKRYAQDHGCSSYTIKGRVQGMYLVNFYGTKEAIKSLIEDHYEEDFEW